MSSTSPQHPLRHRARWIGVASITVALLSTTIVVQSASAAEADCAAVPWMNTSASPDDRAEALLKASTQHQKYRWLVEQPANSPQQTTWTGGVVYPVVLSVPFHRDG